MKNPRTVALVGAGRISRSISRLPGIVETLGPVKAASFRVASAMVNRLRAGYAVAGYDELESCRLVLICAPEEAIPRLARELADAGLQWKGKAVVLCDSRLESHDLAPLAARGASAGTMDAIEALDGPAFVLEGHPEALREARRFLAPSRARIVEIERGKKSLYAAGLAFSGTMFTPLVAASVDCLRRSGMSAAEATALAESNLRRTLRAYLKAGKKGWSGILAARDLGAVRRQLEALGSDNPILGAYFAETARMALEILGADTVWLKSLEQETGAVPRGPRRPAPAQPSRRSTTASSSSD